jgi:hypothetical protein
MQDINQLIAQAAQAATEGALIDGDYTLTEGRAWFTVSGFAVRINTTAEGLIVDIYQNGKEYNAPITTAAVGFDELEADQ